MAHQPRLSVRGVVYFCWLSSALLMVAFMTYLGFFDGFGEDLYDTLKPIGKLLFQ
jgi:hypothetical protein